MLSRKSKTTLRGREMQLFNSKVENRGREIHFLKPNVGNRGREMRFRESKPRFAGAKCNFSIQK